MTDDWKEYKVNWRGEPYQTMEPLDREIAVVGEALDFLVRRGLLPHGDYDEELFLAHRQVIADQFEIPWTGISLRMQRLLYAINAIAQPRVMVAMGVFCGNTFFCNAGAALGPGASYQAQRLIGIEIVAEETERAKRNIAGVDPDGRAEVIAADGVEWLRGYDGTIDLLYIDANGSYFDIVKMAANHGLQSGSLVLAHNSINMAEGIADYLAFVRDPDNSAESVNVCVDDQGLEVTRWR